MPRRFIPLESWPRCPGGCGHAAAPIGEPALRVRFDVDTRNESNLRARWAKVKRTKDARERTIEEVAVALGEGQAIPERGPWYVRMIRISPKVLDSDGLPRALKSVQDTIAAILKVDDGSPLVEWDRRQLQVEGAALGMIIEIWAFPLIDERKAR